MKDLLRDRRTVITMMVIPFFLIPLIFSITSTVSMKQAEKSRAKDLRVAMVTNNTGGELAERLRRRKDLKLSENHAPSTLRQLVRDDSIDMALVIEPGFDEAIERGETGDISLFYRASGDDIVQDRLKKTIDEYSNAVLTQRLDSLGATKATITPTKVKDINVYNQRESIGKLAGGLLPYFFVLFCFMGAMYPAIDLFTGEKERSTIETLLVVPANRLQILIGKMLVVVTAGVVSGLLTIIGLYVALKINPELPSFISEIVSQILSPTSIILIVLMMIPLTTFFAGVLIPASIYAKSFKEAQSLIQPMTIIAIVPLVIGMMPGVQLNFMTALIPILNIALASKEIIAGTIDYTLLAVVFMSLFLLAAIGILLCRRWFSHEGSILR